MKPHRRSKPAKVGAWANSKTWRSQLCYCDGPWWSIKAPHKVGTGACRYRRQDDE